MRRSIPKPDPQPPREKPRRNETVLEIDDNAIPNHAVHALLDDILVPLIVDRLIENLVKSR